MPEFVHDEVDVSGRYARHAAVAPWARDTFRDLMTMLQVSYGDARVASSGVGGSPPRADHRVNESRGDTNDYPHFVRAQPAAGSATGSSL
jgi:hypothetical protein